MIVEAVDSHRQELKVISRGLDLCEGTLCSDVAEMRTWVTSALEEQQKMPLRVMGEVVKLGKAIEGSRRARGAEGKVVKEGGEISGGYGVQEADASAMRESDEGKAQGTPTSPAEAPCVRAEVRDGGCGSAAGAVGGIPDQPRPSTVAGVHVRRSTWVHPMMAAVNEKIKKAAAFERAIGKAAMSSDGASTVSTVLWESRADVYDRAGSDDDGKVKAAGGAAAAVGSMQVEEEAIEATDLREATGCGALPTDGSVWQQLEWELECARPELAKQVL